jgi:hypothetical protein
MTVSIEQLWRRWDTRCAGCSLTADDLKRLGLTRERGRAMTTPGPDRIEVEIPFCSDCLRDCQANLARAHKRLLKLAGDPRQSLLSFPTTDGGRSDAFP